MLALPRGIKAFLQKDPVSLLVLAGEGSMGHLVPKPGKKKNFALPETRRISELQAYMLREVRSKVQRAYQKLSSSGRLCARTQIS